MKTLLITIFMLNAASGGELKSWRGNPFNEIKSLVTKYGISRVYLFPKIMITQSNGIINKEINKNLSFGIIDTAKNINLFSQLMVNNCKVEEYPQLISNEYQLDIIFNKSDPVVTLRAFKVQDDWYLWYMFKDASMKQPIKFSRKCDKEFSDFLTASLIAIR